MCADATSTAEAPSDSCDEVPAVTRPSALNGVLSFASVVEVGVRADALVAGDDAVRRVDRDDLAREVGASARPVRRDRERVHLLAGDPPAVGDQLRADALRYELVAVEQLFRLGRAVLLDERVRRVDRDVVHVLDAGRDDEVVRAGRDSAGA